ncbi:type I restriction endonuclease [Methanocorpusculum sp. GPch4]|uniref:type I restriction endonuclease n=1 Tax=Methanocorpusculum sp. GPch4 TaxID=2527877 RepID=UPI001432FFC1|nr:type I restriction endonuclease [Methanocorpusculum sp. GPch4]
MDFNDQLRAFSVRIPKIIESVKTEEATKNGLILPFLQILGYNVFDPSEVCPECIADVGTKKGEKVDYAIMKEGKPVILIECKSFDVDLASIHMSQLFRYFSVVPAKLGILTNGKKYLFFSDIDAPNKMDTKPFLELDMVNLTDQNIETLKQFRKESFNVDKILPSALNMKYIKEIKQILAQDMESPSQEIVQYFAHQIYDGRLTKNMVSNFTEITKRALNQYINDVINERLKSAMAPELSEKPEEKLVDEGIIEDDSEITTTQSEIEGFYIIRAILSDIVAPERVIMRDVKSYCSIILDDTNRKPICRLYFNSETKRYIGLFNNEKEERQVINSIPDIYKYASQLRDTVKKYDIK